MVVGTTGNSSTAYPQAYVYSYDTDSLTLLPGLEALGQGAKVIDIGSGGGLPGLPQGRRRCGLPLAQMRRRAGPG